MLPPTHQILLNRLRKNAREKFSVMSRATGIPSSTLFDHHQQLQGVITKHTTQLDFRKLGLLRKKFHVRAAKGKTLLAWLEAHPAVNNLYRVDSHEAFVDAIFKSQLEAEEFKEAMSETTPVQLREFDVLETMKEEAFLHTPDDS